MNPETGIALGVVGMLTIAVGGTMMYINNTRPSAAAPSGGGASSQASAGGGASSQASAGGGASSQVQLTQVQSGTGLTWALVPGHLYRVHIKISQPLSSADFLNVDFHPQQAALAAQWTNYQKVGVGDSNEWWYDFTFSPSNGQAAQWPNAYFWGNLNPASSYTISVDVQDCTAAGGVCS
jgi:hypothetical protein